ncbi:group 1 truncated hemoglobin GlbN [Thermopolyspora flexuosa]|jgi:hemoglobin|uniref:Group 1 truncated hemoglobin n=1 Tax=Thermopolyspora flexuosa TaxID=103836 RepID=A0A543IX70_9ACTN|nr:group 1 truncated hemoglobin [Thermopolyspora flexuosa]TQM75157.1 hemoglobin [Thermopolyspora flexuosa]GGM91703.1 group 1 truncated hemoglobin GlbN [Thermopolyspora flexuosa]
MASIFERIGGSEAVAAVVDDFYDRVLADPLLSGFFANTDMGKLKAHQRSFVAAALGGPQTYRGKTMDEAHAGLGIQAEHFDAVVGHLVESLRKHKVAEDVIASIADALAPLKAEIVPSEVSA